MRDSVQYCFPERDFLGTQLTAVRTSKLCDRPPKYRVYAGVYREKVTFIGWVSLSRVNFWNMPDLMSAEDRPVMKVSSQPAHPTPVD